MIVLAGLWFLRGGSDGVAVRVEAAALEPEFTSSVTASGEVVATSYAEIGSDLMGRVVDLLVEEGDDVAAGQTLARLDATQASSAAQASAAVVLALEAERESAREAVRSATSERDAAAAQFEEARANLRRAQELYDQGIYAASLRDTARTQADAAEARLESAGASLLRAEQQSTVAERRISQARAQSEGSADLLAKTEIEAPIAGRVTRLNVREGEMVVIGIQNQPGTTLMTISDLSEINAEIKVAEADVPRVRAGQRTKIVLEALPGRVFEGEVVEIGASALPITGTGAAAREFRVVVRFKDADDALRPGFSCDAEIITEERTDATTVPLQAVVLRQGEDGAETTGVFVDVDGRAVFTPVEAGIIGGIRMEVNGIEPGTSVVVGPYQALRALQDGDAINAASGS